MRETKYWTWHMFAGLIIAVFLGMHMIIMHLETVFGWCLSNPDKTTLDWANVLARSKLASFIIIYTVLLGAALYHGLYGLRNILFELSPPRIFKKIINIVFCFLGIILFIVGTIGTIAIKIKDF